MLSKNGNINDDKNPDHVANENFDDELNFEFESDSPPGRVASSSEEPERLGSESEDANVDRIDFVGWRNDSWMSRRVRRGHRFYKRKIDGSDCQSMLYR